MASAKELRIAQRKMESSILGVQLGDYFRNKDLRNITGVIDVYQIAKLKWNWAGLFEWRPSTDRRNRGTPPTC